MNPSSPSSSQPSSSRRAASRRSLRAFTLMEVMIALGIFAMAGFAILAMVANTLRNARALRIQHPDAGTLASQICITNRLYEGSDSGDFSDLGEVYSGYSWSSDDNEVESNGLHQVDFVVRQKAIGGGVDVRMSILLFRPESPPGSAAGPGSKGGR